MMPRLHVTPHAIARYRERVADVPPCEADRALRSETIQKADCFGAPYVRLPGRQHVVLRRHAVVTVLPAETPLPYLARYRIQED